MRVLGAIVAGGASRRFGRDKALAMIGGVRLIDHVCAVLSAQVDDVVLCGRSSDRMRWIPDLPEAGLGPLGGLNAALADAGARDFDMVVTVPVDVYPLPPDLVDRLNGHGARVFASQHLIGRWPGALAPALEAHLAAGHRSLRSWILAVGAIRVDDSDLGLLNVNTHADLLAAERQCAPTGSG